MTTTMTTKPLFKMTMIVNESGIVGEPIITRSWTLVGAKDQDHAMQVAEWLGNDRLKTRKAGYIIAFGVTPINSLQIDAENLFCI